MLHFFLLAHGSLGWSDDILFAAVLAAIVSYVLGMWFAGRRFGQRHDTKAVKEPEHLSLD
jgi:hypothetical protein